MRMTALAVVLAVAAGCATGPRRQSLPEYVAEPKPQAVADEPEPATPFSAGLMLGAGFSLEDGAVLPTQLAVGSLKVMEVRGRGLNLLALGGVSQTDVSSARLSWGFGMAYQLTPDTLAYEVDAGAGVLWLQGAKEPAAVFGFVLTPKM